MWHNPWGSAIHNRNTKWNTIEIALQYTDNTKEVCQPAGAESLASYNKNAMNLRTSMWQFSTWSLEERISKRDAREENVKENVNKIFFFNKKLQFQRIDESVLSDTLL